MINLHKLSLVLAVYFLFRGLGSMLRHKEEWRPVRWVGWFVVCGANWFFLAMLGFMVPLWMIALTGAVFGTICFKRVHLIFSAFCDATVVFLCALLTVPNFDGATVTFLVFVLSFVGGSIDLSVLFLPKRWKKAVFVFFLVGTVSVVSLKKEEVGDLLRYQKKGWLKSLGRGLAAEKMTLPNGSVAWLERPAHPTPRGALLFHGAHTQGSQQPSAHTLRRVFLAAGYTVLSVDHPGFGESPNFSFQAPVEKWDPTPGHQIALRRLQAVEGIRQIVLVGHSLGCESVLRLLINKPDSPVEKAYLFGVGLRDMREQGNYWYKRFHKDRRMTAEMPRDKWDAIYNRYHNRLELVQTLPADHPPVVLIDNEFEFDDVRRTRSLIFQLVPGLKERWELQDSHHYFNSQTLADVLLLDRAIMKKLANKLQ